MRHEPYRSRDQINYEILNAIKEYNPEEEGINKTRLMMIAQITSDQANEYLRELEKNGLIWRDISKSVIIAASATDPRKLKGARRGITYHITQRGIQFLVMMDEMRQSFGMLSME